MVKPLYWYLVFTLFRPEIISYFPLLLHACTEPKLISLIMCVVKGFYFQIINPLLFTHCFGVCKLEEVRLYLGLYYYALSSFWWPWLGLWVYVVRRLILMDWYCLWWSGSFLFGFSQWLILVLVLMTIIQVVWVLLLCPLLWFHICGIMTCLFILCSEKYNW